MATKRSAKIVAKSRLIRALNRARRQLRGNCCAVCGEPVPPKADYCDALCAIFDAIREALGARPVIETAKAILADAIQQDTIKGGRAQSRALQKYVQMFARKGTRHGSKTSVKAKKTQRPGHR